MCGETQALVLGIAGLVSTLVSTGLGLYFTARARTAPMRDLLYTKQLDLAQHMLRALGRARVFAILLTPDGEYREQAREDMGRLAKRLSILTDEAAALFPTELYAGAKQVSDTLTSLLVEYDEKRDTKALLDQLVGQEAKAALMVRALLGIDELSEEGIRLFSKRDTLRRLAETSPQDLLAVGRGTRDAR